MMTSFITTTIAVSLFIPVFLILSSIGQLLFPGPSYTQRLGGG